MRQLVDDVSVTVERVAVTITWVGGHRTETCVVRPVARLSQLSYCADLFARARGVARAAQIHDATAELLLPCDPQEPVDAGRTARFVRADRLRADPELMAKAIVEATANFEDADLLAKVSRGLGDAMKGLEIATLDVKLAERGW